MNESILEGLMKKFIELHTSDLQDRAAEFSKLSEKEKKVEARRQASIFLTSLLRDEETK